MAKRDQRFPYRTVFEYPPSDRAPDGIKARQAKTDEWSARHLAEQVARRGGTAQVIHVAEDRTETVIATITPDDVERDEED